MTEGYWKLFCVSPHSWLWLRGITGLFFSKERPVLISRWALIPSIIMHLYIFWQVKLVSRKLYKTLSRQEIEPTQMWRVNVISGGSKAGCPRRAPEIFLISCSFWKNLANLYVGTPWRLALPHTGNPESASCYVGQNVLVFHFWF